MALALCAGACAAGGDDEPQPPVDNITGNITLTLRTRAVDNALSDAASDTEKMHNLRVVILSRSGMTGWQVEHNDFVSFNTMKLSDTREYEVKPNSLKRIYLIANAGNEMADASGTVRDLSMGINYLPGADGKALIDNVMFSLPADQGTISSLPMSAVYDMNIGPDVEKASLQAYVVRAVNKLSLTVENNTAAYKDGADRSQGIWERKIKVLGWKLDGIAKDNYLMPHVNIDGSSYWVADTDRKSTVNLPGHWSDWLAEEVKKSSAGDIERYQWLTDYELPDDENSIFEYTYTDPQEIGYIAGSNLFVAPAPVYFHESRNIADADDPLMLQQYTFTLVTEELIDGETQWRHREYTAVLPQLASLFRDTHVVVNVNIHLYEIELKVEEQPYSYVVLEPDFGLDRDENGNIIVKDKD